VLYTVMPAEVIWAEAEAPSLKSVVVRGRTLLVQPDGPDSGVIVALLSTDPSDFLDANFTPGTRVRW
jgi:hypothetical protein